VAGQPQRQRQQRGEYPWRDQRHLHTVQSAGQQHRILQPAGFQQHLGRYFHEQCLGSVLVLPSTNSVIKWSKPVVINGLTAAQILGLPGAFVGATSFGGSGVVTVTNGATIFTFDTTASASLSGGFGGNKTGVYTGGAQVTRTLTWFLVLMWKIAIMALLQSSNHHTEQPDLRPSLFSAALRHKRHRRIASPNQLCAFD